MKQLFLDFWTTKSFAIRVFRVGLVAAGSVMVGEATPLPDEYRWVGYLVATLGAAITGRDQPADDVRR